MSKEDTVSQEVEAVIRDCANIADFVKAHGAADLVPSDIILRYFNLTPLADNSFPEIIFEKAQGE